jgi:hypothetical protein
MTFAPYHIYIYILYTVILVVALYLFLCFSPEPERTDHKLCSSPIRRGNLLPIRYVAATDLYAHSGPSTKHFNKQPHARRHTTLPRPDQIYLAHRVRCRRPSSSSLLPVSVPCSCSTVDHFLRHHHHRGLSSLLQILFALHPIIYRSNPVGVYAVPYTAVHCSYIFFSKITTVEGKQQSVAATMETNQSLNRSMPSKFIRRYLLTLLTLYTQKSSIGCH